MVETMAVKAMTLLVRNIMSREPKNMVTAVTRLPRDWFMVWPMVSTSLVTRLSTSPKLTWL